MSPNEIATLKVIREVTDAGETWKVTLVTQVGEDETRDPERERAVYRAIMTAVPHFEVKAMQGRAKYPLTLKVPAPKEDQSAEDS